MNRTTSPLLRVLGSLPTDSGCHRHEHSAGRPQIRGREKRRDLRGVSFQTAVANLRESALALDHPNRRLELRTNARLQPLNLVKDRIARVARIELAPFARSRATCEFFIVPSDRFCARW
jgi:hypothetical protein